MMKDCKDHNHDSINENGEDCHSRKSHGNFHGHDHGRVLTNKKKFAIVIFFNSVITLAEYIGGILSGSLALLSDAGHNLSDVLSLMLGYAGEKVSEVDSNKKYSFGLKRFEVLIALINALSLVAIGMYIVYEAAARYVNPVQIKIEIMLPIAVVGLLGNVFSILVLLKSKNTNLNIKAAFLHLLYDAVSSVAVIIAGIILYFTNYAWIDLAISLIIVIMIVWSSTDIIKVSLRIFMQGTPLDIDSDNVYSDILNISGVGGAHGLHIWSINSMEIFLSCHICLDQKNKKIDNDDLIRRVNLLLEKKYNITHTTLQIENFEICENKAGNCCR